MSSKGQGTLELLIIFAAGMLALVVVAAILPSQVAGNQALRDGQIARDTVANIASVANEVYLSGDGAQRSIWITIPENAKIANSFIGARTGETDWSKKKLVSINMANEGDIFSVSRAPLCGSWPAVAGRYQINITYSKTPVAHVMINSNC